MAPVLNNSSGSIGTYKGKGDVRGEVCVELGCDLFELELELLVGLVFFRAVFGLTTTSCG